MAVRQEQGGVVCKGRRWTEAEVELLRQGFGAGIPDDEMAVLLRRTHVAIKQKRKRMKITGDPNQRRLSDKARTGMARKKRGPESHSWKGGRRITSGGYVEIHMPSHHRARKNGYVFEHIVVAEKKEGRRMSRDECVHHADGNKENNSPENIIVIKRSAHSGQHARLRSRKVEMICSVCHAPFYVKPSHREKRKTCSKSCAAQITLWRGNQCQ
jgi:hypothetical protein